MILFPVNNNCTAANFVLCFSENLKGCTKRILYPTEDTHTLHDIASYGSVLTRRLNFVLFCVYFSTDGSFKQVNINESA